MWVNIDTLKADIKDFATKTEKQLAKEELSELRAMLVGELVAFHKLKEKLEWLEEVYKKHGLEYIEGMKEEWNEEQGEIQR